MFLNGVLERVLEHNLIELIETIDVDHIYSSLLPCSLFWERSYKFRAVREFLLAVS
jgi:hypothetical protein